MKKRKLVTGRVTFGALFHHWPKHTQTSGRTDLESIAYKVLKIPNKCNLINNYSSVRVIFFLKVLFFSLIITSGVHPKYVRPAMVLTLEPILSCRILDVIF
jgi:hypothetical protein